MTHAFDFTCIVCGYAMRAVPVERLAREGPSCDGCGSSVRLRSVVYELVRAFYPKVAPLPELAPMKHITGVGLSDWEGYSHQLERLFSYRNTFYHAEPFLDIAHISAEYEETADFLISTDVFEHVPPPVGYAFHGARRVLRPGGLLVLTVPHLEAGPGHEHFPDLHEFALTELPSGWVLVNRAADGHLTARDGLVFHGGPGSVLEMRTFGREEVFRYLAEAGFEDIQSHDGNVPEWGIVLLHRDGVPFTARRQAGGTGR